eukprot:XP_008760178.1 PREDICTED: dynein heavy chain 17, axonemal-like isoform X3 [Rattus norvegicus]
MENAATQGKKTARMNVREEMHQEIPSRAQSVTINARKDESYLKKYSHLWTDGKIEFMKQCLLHGRFLGAEAPELHAGCECQASPPQLAHFKEQVLELITFLTQPSKCRN